MYSMYSKERFNATFQLSDSIMDRIMKDLHFDNDDIAQNIQHLLVSKLRAARNLNKRL